MEPGVWEGVEVGGHFERGLFFWKEEEMVGDVEELVVAMLVLLRLLCMFKGF